MLHKIVERFLRWRERARQRRLTAPNVANAVREAKRDAGTNAAQFGEDQTLHRW